MNGWKRKADSWGIAMGQWGKQGFLEQHTRTTLSTKNSTVSTQEKPYSSPW